MCVCVCLLLLGTFLNKTVVSAGYRLGVFCSIYFYHICMNLKCREHIFARL